MSPGAAERRRAPPGAAAGFCSGGFAGAAARAALEPTKHPTPNPPGMSQCIGAGRWSEMCKRDPKLYLCAGDATKLTDKGWGRTA